ncbi:hypothetical protein [Deinococcus misasensis]|uniref:hypothetical protein n=1 Tax=Deinococcus misasensis TaxID=392413 RepID=UPI000552045A|nr:hypothetical protein [Deinococcus misasensis]
MSRIVFARSYHSATELLLEDENVMDQNVWYDPTNIGEPKYMLIEAEYSDVDSYNQILKPYEDLGFIQVMPYGELAYYFKIVRKTYRDEDVNRVVEFYIENDSWPDAMEEE